MSENELVVKRRKYSWESSNDAGRDVEEAIEDIIDLYGAEWPGTLKVTISYEKE